MKRNAPSCSHRGRRKRFRGGFRAFRRWHRKSLGVDRRAHPRRSDSNGFFSFPVQRRRGALLALQKCAYCQPSRQGKDGRGGSRSATDTCRAAESFYYAGKQQAESFAQALTPLWKAVQKAVEIALKPIPNIILRNCFPRPIGTLFRQ